VQQFIGSLALHRLIPGHELAAVTGHLRPSQVCEILAGTWISRREKW
jgi:hypothetical protein